MPERADRQAGFSLVEMIVALLLVTLVFAIAAGAFLEAGRLLGHTAARALDDRPDLAADLLRRDLRTLRLGTVGSPVWTSSDLVLLRTEDGLVVTWFQLGERLARRATTPADSTNRELLDDLVGWRWRVRPGGLVEVELAVRRYRSAFVRSAGSTRVRPDRGDLELIRVVVGTRVGRQGRW